MEPIICYLITFLGMTLLGFYFQVLGEAELYLYAGFAAGTVIFFIIGQMIVKKTPRIYNLKSLKSAGLYALIAVLFLVGLNFDLTGFEKRVPAQNDVKSFTMSESFNSGMNPNVEYVDGEPANIFYGTKGGLQFKDPENIKAVLALHQALIEGKAKLKDMNNVFSSNVSLGYNPGTPLPMTRLYQINYDFYQNSPEFKRIYESKEYKDYYAPSNLKYNSIGLVYVNSNMPTQMTIEVKGKTDIEEFLACLDQDYKAQTFEEMASLKHSYGTASIQFTYKSTDSSSPSKLLNGSVSYKITDGSKNTIKWLADHGYSSRFEQNVSDIAYIELYHYVQTGENGNHPEMIADQGFKEGVTTSENQKTLKITDPARIQELLDIYETQNTNYADYYYGTIVFRGDGSVITDPDQFYKEYGVAYSPETAEKYAIEDGSLATMQIYFNEGNVPDYVLDYFK